MIIFLYFKILHYYFNMELIVASFGDIDRSFDIIDNFFRPGKENERVQ